MDPTCRKLANSALKMIVSELNTKKLLNDPNFESIIGRVFDLLNSSNLGKTGIVQRFSTSITCLLCKEYMCEVCLSCSHQFCRACIQNQISDQNLDFSLPLSHKNTPKCPCCSKNLNKNDINLVYNKNFVEETKEPKSLQKCEECGFDWPLNKFYYSCMHLCVFCGFKNIVSQTSCKVCNRTNLTPNAKEFQKPLECLGCNQKKNIVEDCLIEICDEHLHCYTCLKDAWKQMKCKFCQKILDLRSQKIIKKQIFETCSACGNIVENKFLVNKKCCNEPVCQFCQKKAKIPAKCKFCETQLSLYSTITLSKLV